MGRIYSGPRMAIALLLALVATHLTTTGLQAQIVSREPNAAEVAALLRGHEHPGQALAVLTQIRGPQPQQKMDEIADSLVSIASAFPGNDARGSRTRDAALVTLVLAGIGAREGAERAVPYAGAADRLRRIAATANDVGIRGGALRGLTKLPDKTRLLPFLRDVATSQNIAAWVAVDILTSDTGPEGKAIARELHRKRLVTQEIAWELLDRLAFAYGWRGARG
jgi:hypothetical protein